MSRGRAVFFGVAALFFGFRVHDWISGALFLGLMVRPMIDVAVVALVEPMIRRAAVVRFDPALEEQTFTAARTLAADAAAEPRIERTVS